MNLSSSKRIVNNFYEVLLQNKSKFINQDPHKDIEGQVSSVLSRIAQSKKINRFTSRYLELVKDTFEDLDNTIKN